MILWTEKCACVVTFAASKELLHLHAGMSLVHLRFVGVSYLSLCSHEGKSHTALEEVQINKSTGNTLLFLQKKIDRGADKDGEIEDRGQSHSTGTRQVWEHFSFQFQESRCKIPKTTVGCLWTPTRPESIRLLR